MAARIAAAALPRRPPLTAQGVGRRCLALASSEAVSGTTVSSAAKLLGRVEASASSGVVQQADVIFARMRNPTQASTQQLIDSLGQLSNVAQGAPSDELEGLAARQPMQQLLAELTLRLPRDSGERVQWEHPWTQQVARSLRDLRLPDVETRLLVRLGHALVQASPQMELEELLSIACDLCAADRRGVAPDDYTLWVLGSRLEELCSIREPGELGLPQLVPLLYLFAHPAIRSRVAGRASTSVLRHVRHGLAECQPGALAKLLQAYSDVLGIVTDALQVLAKAPEGSLKAVTLPELTAIAAALPEQEGDFAKVAMPLLQRLRDVLQEDTEGASIDLAAMTAANAHTAVASAPEAEKLLKEILDILGSRAFGGSSSKESLPSEAIASLIKLQFLQTSATEAAKWVSDATDALAPRIAELPSVRLAELARALAFTAQPVAAPELMSAMQTAAEARASSLSPEEFADIASSLAVSGVLEARLFDAFDVEASLTRPLPLASIAPLVWALAAAGSESPVTWPLVEQRLRASRDKLSELTAFDRSYLYEALKAQGVAGEPWLVGSTAASICEDEAFRASFLERRSEVAPASAHGDLVAELLTGLSLRFERDVEGEDGLYNKAFFLPTRKVVLDLLPLAPRHPVSRRARGDLALRHRVWSAQSFSVLAVPDLTWAQLADGLPEKEARVKQMDWLKEKLDNIVRRDLIDETGIDEELAERLADVPFNVRADKGLSADGLRKLAEAPTVVQERSVEAFLSSWKEQKVRNPTAWMIGIVNKEEKRFQAQEKRRKEEQRATTEPASAAVTRPESGWGRSEGRPLEDAKPGERLSGEVVNVMYARVWVNAGFVGDVTFSATPGRFKLGDKVLNLEVVGVDSAKNCVQAKTTAQTRVRRVHTEAEVGSVDAPGAKPKAKAKAKGKAKAKAKAGAKREEEGQQAAASPKPDAGWGHEGGFPLEELKVGDLVGGKITNVLHERVWVDIGAAKDASFWTKAPAGTYKVGDEVKDLPVTSVNLKKGHVLIQPPPLPGSEEAAKAEAAKAE